MDLRSRSLRDAIAQTHRARNYIIDEVMLKAIAEPRKELSPYAPKMATMTIDVDKIAEVIGARGKVIKKIIEESQCEIDTEDDGKNIHQGHGYGQHPESYGYDQPYCA